MAVVICAGLLGLTFEDRLRGSVSHESDIAEPPPETDTLAGLWDTSYGPMTIKVNSMSTGGQTEHVTGSWKQGGNTGYVTSGTFNRQSGVFQFSFSEPWHQATGTAQFVRGSDGIFSGTWSFTGNASMSHWSMQRPVRLSFPGE
ncbi:MAG: hypothetical protein O2820_20350 [Planctomycetota bacterium]|nr:hypothetical protein [Planctomycetota bacterium]